MSKTLRDMRLEKGVLQQDVAEVIGVTDTTISNWEMGTMPGAEAREKLASYYGVSVPKLIQILKESKRQSLMDRLSSAG